MNEAYTVLYSSQAVEDLRNIYSYSILPFFPKTISCLLLLMFFLKPNTELRSTTNGTGPFKRIVPSFSADAVHIDGALTAWGGAAGGWAG